MAWWQIHRRRQRNRDLDEEISHDLALEVEERIRSGIPLEEAEHSTRRDFGSVLLVKEVTREMWGWTSIETLAQDLLYGLRVLRKNPGFTAAAVLSLALGIGANTTVFSVVNAVFLRSLPVQEPDRLVILHGTRRDGDLAAEHSYPDYLDFHHQTEVFSSVAAQTPVVLGLSGGAEPERIWGALVTGNYFSMLGVHMAYGRAMLPEDDSRPTASAVAILGYGLWRRNFAADPNIVGRQIHLNHYSFTVVGIAPESFHGADPRAYAPELWIPLVMQAQLIPDEPLANRTNRDHRWLTLIGRLRSGVSRQQAQSAMDVVTRRLADAYPNSNAGCGVRLDPAGSVYPEYKQLVSRFLTVLMVFVGLVLVIACANVANLLLGRAAARRKEIGIRLAIGAGRSRVVRQLLTESLLLAFAGGAGALVLSFWTLKLITRIRIPLLVPIHVQFALDARTFGVTALLCAITAIVFGLAPALAATRLGLVPSLKAEGTASEHPGRVQIGRLLVVPQMALSLVLLVSTGLCMRSLRNTQAIDIGFRADHVLLLSVDPSLHGYSDAQAVTLFRHMQERISALPAVRAASVTDRVPISFGANQVRIGIDGREFPREGAFNRVTSFIVAPRYFETMGIPLLRGHDFTQERKQSRPEAIINEAMARRFWPGPMGPAGAAGERFNIGGVSFEVIAVARDEKARTLGEDPTLCVFLPMAQNYWSSPFGMTVVVRTEVNPYSLVAPVKQQIEGLDRNLAVFNIESLEDHVRTAQLLPRLAVSLFGAFGAIGLLLATVGLYGVVSYSVRRRTREIGIRMALGAEEANVRWMVVRQGMGLAMAGTAIGLITAYAVTRLLASFLYRVSATDLLTFVMAPLVLVTVAALASYVPARRATRVDPLLALRQE